MTAFDDVRTIVPAMPASGPPRWPGARWIGALDVHELAEMSQDRLVAMGSEGFDHARILLRDGIDVLGFVEIELDAGSLGVAELKAVADGYRDRATATVPEVTPHGAAFPPMTVAVSTRDRVENLPGLIDTLLKLDYPDFDVLIVDNASAGTGVVDYVTALGHPRVRVVREPQPGVSRGRNLAMREATNDIIAFTDDDGAADPLWLKGLARGFARSPEVGLVTGMVPSGDLTTPAQGYFERRIAWEVTARPRVFRIDDRPADIPLFPFEVSAYGTGANFAITRELALRLGGMSEALGAGSPSGGGEDIDLFVRALYAGAALAYEPSAIVWHRHRPEASALQGQLATYGRGMGAWITSVLGDRRTRGDALRLLAGVARRLPTLGSSPAEHVPGPDSPPTGINDRALRWVEVRGMAAGPWCYLRSRRDGRVIRPLA